MDKFELLHNTFYALPLHQVEAGSDNGNFIKFLLNKYDEELLRKALENPEDGESELLSYEAALTLADLQEKFSAE